MAEKEWATLEAKAALARCVARRYELEDGRLRISITRWNWPPRFFQSISAAEAFIRRVEGKA